MDTLAYAQKLEAAGIQPKYAEAHAEALSEVIAKEMVTEDRLKIILNNELKTRFDDLDVDLKTRFEDMVKQINKEQRTIFAELKSYLLLRILGGMSIGFTILAVIIGIFSR